MFNVQAPPIEEASFAIGAIQAVFWLAAGLVIVMIVAKVFLFIRAIIDREAP